MVANWASSRGHIGLPGLAAAPCAGGGGGGGPGGFVCATASTLSALAPRSAMQAKIHRKTEVIRVSGISGRRDHAAPAQKKPKAQPTRPHIPASRGSVTSFPGHLCGGRGVLFFGDRRFSPGRQWRQIRCHPPVCTSPLPSEPTP